jgi:hypothetical protein
MVRVRGGGGVFVRARAAVIVSAALLAGLTALFPDCQRGAMSGVPADQWRTWLGHAAGMEPLWHKSLSAAVLIAAGPALALAVAGWRIVHGRGPVRATWLALGAMVLLGGAAMVASARSYSLANVVAAVPLAWALSVGLSACERRWRGLRRVVSAVAVTLGVLLAPYALSYAGKALSPAGRPALRCDPAALPDALAAMPANAPPGLMAAPIFAGPYVLTVSAHNVLGAQYHRNVAGNRKAHAIAAADTSVEARAAIRRHGVDYVAVCRRHDPLAGRFFRKLGQGKAPAWLQLVVDEGDGGKMYRIYSVNK